MAVMQKMMIIRTLPQNSGGGVLYSRGKKILIPYYLIVAVVLSLNVFTTSDANISVKDFLMFFFCVQDYCGDYFYRLPGLGHLWYITMLVLLYCVISITFKFRKYIKRFGGQISLLVMAVQILITLFVDARIGRYIFYMLVGFVSFWIAYAEPNFRISRGRLFTLVTVLVALLWIFRMYLYLKGCNTDIYNNVYTYYTQVFMSIWIVYALYIVEYKGFLRDNVIIKMIESLSYEIFLVHFMFIDGPLNIVGRLDNLVVEGILVIAISVIAAFSLSKISKFLINRVFVLNKGALSK